MKAIRQVSKGGEEEEKEGEQEGGYICGMRDEQGHESDAGETTQNSTS